MGIVTEGLSERDDVVSLIELQRVVGISDKTLRKLMTENADFPVLVRGAPGVEYQFAARDVKAWLDAHEAKLEAAKRERQEQLSQLSLDLLSGESAGEAFAGLTPSEQKVALENEALAMKLSRERGQLVLARDVEAALERVITTLRQDLLSLPDRMFKMQKVDRDTRAAVLREIEAALDAAASRLEVFDDDARAA